ncbi:MAG: filamentous hemagglutinin N-terminal domain-containing protein [Candidatus Omnitrophica bacterium]|nr:filamentous hemagglutinin N-terminal domain-containing protein [Candidatus Omnitrophota bacterium]
MGTYRLTLDKYLRVILVLAMASGIAFRPAFAGELPQGEQVVYGDASFDRSQANALNISTSDRAIINYNSFSIGTGNTVNFLQPGASSVALNRVTGGNISEIFGFLNANGNIFLINPNGILFGPGSSVNVAGLVASSLDMNNDDFKSGNYHFQNQGLTSAFVINQGSLIAASGGGISLLGGAVRNEGVIQAHMGSVNLASGDAVTLDLDSRGLISAAVDDKVKNAVSGPDGQDIKDGVNNSGTITADGGLVNIRAEAVDGIFDNLINQEGTVRASSLVNSGGEVILTSNSSGIIQNSGGISVSAVDDDTDGGDVSINGEKVGQFGEIHADSVNGDGGNIDLFASDTLALDSDSLTTANSELSGNGGRVIVYSPETTLFWSGAIIYANGGALSGDGGFIEVSGREHVEVYGKADATAPNGKAGTFYIDPGYNLTINGADFNGGWAGGVWGSTGINSTVNAGTINTNLNTGTSVTLNTAGGAQAGNITQGAAGAINKSAGNIDVNLILNAQGSITLSQGIANTGGTGKLNVTLAAITTVDVNSAITTGGGNFTSSGTSFDSNASGTITTSGGNVNLTGHTGAVGIRAAVNSGVGSFSSSGTNFQTIAGGTITTNGGNVDLTGHSGTVNIRDTINTGTGSFISDGTSFDSQVGATITTNGGNVDLSAHTTGVQIRDQINTNGGTFSSAGTTFENLTSGTISTSGGGGGVTLNHSGAVTLGLAVTTGGGAFQSSGTTFNNTSGTITTNGGSVTINNTGVVTVGNAIDTSGGTGGGISFTNPSSLRMGANLSTDNGTVTVSGGKDIDIRANGVTIDTETGNNNNAGAVNLGTSNIYANAVGYDFNIDASTSFADASGGAVTIGLVDNNAGGDKYINDFSVTTDAAIDGTITLGNNILVDTNGDLSSVSLTGDIRLGASITIDTEQDNNASAGGITLAGTGVSANAANRDLTLNTATTNAGSAGGNVTSVALSNAGGSYVDDLSITTTGGAGGTNGTIGMQATRTTNTQTYTTGSGGTVTLNGDLTTTNNNITFAANTPVSLGGPVTINAGTATVTVNNNLAAGANALILTADEIDLLGGANSVTGSSTILLQPSAAATSIGIAGGAGILDLSAADILALKNGFSSITIGRLDTSGLITVSVLAGNVTFYDPVTIQSPSGSITVNGLVTGSDDASVTIDGGGATTLNANITTAGRAINISDNVLLGANILLDTTNVGGTVTGAAIGITGTTDSSGANRNLSLRAGTTGVISLTGAVGAGGGVSPINVLTIISSNGATFSNSVTANTITISDSAAASTVAFLDNTTALTGMSAAGTANAYNISFTGGTNTIAGVGATTLANTGSVTFGNGGGDASAFAGGLTHTAGINAIDGNISSTNAPINLNNTTSVTGSSTLAAGSGLITLGNTTLSDGVTLTLGTGGSGGATVTSIAGTAGLPASNVTFNLTGAVSVTGTVGTDIGVVTITNSGGATFGNTFTANTITISDSAAASTVAFLDNTTASAGMSAAGTANAYNISFTGGTNTIAGATNFLNTGTVTLGNDNTDSSTFTGGLQTDAGPSATHTRGTVNTTNTAMTLGALTLDGTTTLDAGTNTITLNGITTGATNTFTLTADEMELNAAINGTGAITLQPSTVTRDIDIAGPGGVVGALNLTAPELGQIADGHPLITIGRTNSCGVITINAITFHDPATIQSPVVFGIFVGAIIVNGTIQDDHGSGTLTLDGSGATTTLNADIITDRVAINILDSVEVGAALVTLDTTFAGAVGSEAGADISILGTTDSTLGGAKSLTLNAGFDAIAVTGGNITLTGAVGATRPLNALNIIQANDVTFSGAVRATNIDQADSQGITTFADNITTTGSVGGYGIDLRSKTGMVLGDPGPAITINAGAFAIRFVSDAFTFNVGLITASAITIAPYTPGTLIGVEDNTKGFNITDLFLDSIAIPMTIGDAASGAITIANGAAVGNVNLTQNKDLTFISGGAIHVIGVGAGPAITTTAGGKVTFTNGGLLTIDAASGDMVLDGAFTQNGAGAASTAGDITTSNDLISFLTPVTLTGNVLLSTQSVAGIGNINFTNTVNGGFDLGLNSGTGDIVFGGIVGGGARLSNLTITGANDVTATDISSVTITQLGGTGTTTFNGALDTNAAGGVDLTGNAFTFNNTVNTAGGGIVEVTNAGLLTIAGAGDMTLDGSFTQNGAGAVSTAGDITTTNDNISFATAVTLTGNVLLNTGAGIGNVIFNNTLNGTVAGTETLGLTAGTGNITFTGAVGGGTRLGAVTVTSTTDVTAAAIRASSLTQVAGTGTTTFNGALDTNAAGGVDLTGNAFTFNNTVNTAGGGIVEVTNAGLLTIAGAGDMTLDGSFTQNGAGAVSTAGDITTTNDDISFATAVTLTGNVLLNTGAGIGDITFNNTIDATTAYTETLGLTAGTGTINLNGIVGGGTPLGTITINSAGNANLVAITATALNQVAGSGTTTFNGLVNTTNNDSITTGTIVFTGATARLNANNGANNVTLTAGVGGITSGAAANDITANNLVMDTQTGIGAVGNRLETQVTNLEAITRNAGGGNIYITEANALNIGGAGALTGISTTNGLINVQTTDGSITVSEAVDAGNAQQITLFTQEAGEPTNADITLAANVSSNLAGGGAIYLNSADAITQTGGSILARQMRVDSQSGTILNQLTNHLSDGANGLAGSVAEAPVPGVFDSKAFSYTDAANFAVGIVLGESGITTQGSNIHLRSGGTITFNNDVISNGGDIYLENATAGQIIAVGWDPLLPGTFVIDPAALPFIHLIPGAGLIWVGGTNSGNAYVGPADFTVGGVRLNVGIISGGNIIDGTSWTLSATPALTSLFTAARGGLQANNGYIGTAALPINTSLDSLESFSNGATWINETDNITLGSIPRGTSVATADGLINVVAAGIITVDTVTAGGVGRDVWLTTTGVDQDIDISGNITALDDTVYLNASGDITDTTDSTSRIRAGTLQIDAADTVGSPAANGRLDTEVDWYLNHRVTAGDAYFYEVNDVILRDLESPMICS